MSIENSKVQLQAALKVGDIAKTDALEGVSRVQATGETIENYVAQVQLMLDNSSESAAAIIDMETGIEQIGRLYVGETTTMEVASFGVRDMQEQVTTALGEDHSLTRQVADKLLKSQVHLAIADIDPAMDDPSAAGRLHTAESETTDVSFHLDKAQKAYIAANEALAEAMSYLKAIKPHLDGTAEEVRSANGEIDGAKTMITDFIGRMGKEG